MNLYTCLYIYNKNYFLYILFSPNTIKLKPKLNLITISINLHLKNGIKLKNQIKQISYSITAYFLKKIKIAGKSYRIEKLNNGFNLTVGHTLNTFVCIENIIQKQTTKHKIIFFFTNFNKTQQFFFKIIYLRLWDVYTQRGLRFGKHKLYKKQGKKSSYV